MKRRFIPIEKIEIYDKFHQRVLGSDDLIVNQELYGNTTEYHKEGIRIIKDVLEGGKKVLPVLVYEDDEGHYTLLDGFKRVLAHIELGYTNIEAFICDFREYNAQLDVPFGDKKMKCWKGGQNYEIFGLYEGNSEGEDDILYWNGLPSGLRIEMAESIQIHWGYYGKYRLSLGRRDFIELATAISNL